MTTRGVGIAGRLGALLLPGVVATCGGDAPPGVDALDLEVSLAGCASIVAGPVCEVGTEPLSLWVETQADVDAVTVLIGARPVAARRIEPADGSGSHLVVDVPVAALPGAEAAAPTVELAVVARHGDREIRWTHPLQRPAPIDALAAADRLRKAGRFDQARSALAAPLPPGARARAASLLARIDLAQGRADAAIAGLRDAIAMHRGDGRLSAVAADAFALSHALRVQRRDLRGARRALDDVADVLPSDADARVRAGYFRGLVARDEGDLRGAQRLLAEAEVGAARLGLGLVERNARLMSAQLALGLGQVDRAVESLDALARDLPADASDCERADVATGRTWAELLSIGALTARPARVALERARPAVAFAKRALALYRDGCSRPADVANARVNLALAALAAGDTESVAELLAEARAEAAAPVEVAAWIAEIDARLALARGDVRGASAQAAELERRAGDAPDAQWRARVLTGVTREAAGEDAAALAAYRQAEAGLRALGARVPINDGRASFLAQRDVGGRLLVDLLVRRGALHEALAVARASRVATIAGALRGARLDALDAERRARFEADVGAYLHERDALDADAADDWSVAADRAAERARLRQRRERDAQALLDRAFAELGDGAVELAAGRAPTTGELLVVLQPSADGGSIHVLVATDDGRVLHHAAGRSAPLRDVDALLGPLVNELGSIGRVRILAVDTLDELDVHALPWRGVPLVAQISVEYGADLPAASATAARALDLAPSRRALVVADTRDDLPKARSEAAELGARLAAVAPTEVLVGRRAQRVDVVARLGQATFFHFAGHGRRGARADWQSALLLADSAELRAGDVLALDRVPEAVVLSGCDTARGARSERADASLAHAFLAAGASVVVATTRPVSDRLARALSSELSVELDADGWDLATAFRRAIARVARNMPDSDWQAYRLMTR